MESNIFIKPDPDSILAPDQDKSDTDNDRIRASEFIENPATFLHLVKEDKIECEVDPAELIPDDEHYSFLDENIKVKIEAGERDEDSEINDFRMNVKQELDCYGSDHNDPRTANTCEMQKKSGEAKIKRQKSNVEMIECCIDPMSINSVVTQNVALNVVNDPETANTGEVQQKSGETKIKSQKSNVEMIECCIDPMTINSIVTQNVVLNVNDPETTNNCEVQHKSGETKIKSQKSNVEMIECCIDPMTINSAVTQNEALNVDSCDVIGRVLRSGLTHEESDGQEPNPILGNKIKVNSREKSLKREKKPEPIDHFKRDRVEERKFTCDICQKWFSSRSELCIHIRSHIGVKLHECSVCNMIFSQLGHLKDHKKVHSNEKAVFKFRRARDRSVECHVCKAVCPSSSAFLVHFRMHTGEKPYKCQVCTSAFASQSNLTVHNRVHTGERPYKCELCKKGFFSSSALVIHAGTHTGEKPYKCEVCERKFTRLGSLNRHGNTHSSEK